MRRAKATWIFGILCSCLFAQSPGTEKPATSAIVRIGPTVHVSSAIPSSPHYEMEMAANPEDPNELMACSMLLANDSPTTDVVTYVSFDAGKTWSLTLRTQGEGRHPSWDPACQYGPGNIAYSISEGIGKKSPSSFNRIDRSLDGGHTWKEAVRFIHGERTFLAVDHREGAQNGWLYFFGMGDAVDKIRISWSTDQGVTVTSQLAPVDQGYRGIGMGPGVILSDGTLVAPVPEYKATDDPVTVKVKRPGNLAVVRAEFQRPNWPLKITTSTVSPWFIDREPNGSSIPRLAVDHSDGPFRDRIYATWEDLASGRSQVYLSFSADKGATWSRPRVINDDAPRQIGDLIKGPDDIHGLVAVNKQGVVGVSWYDRREEPANLGWTVRFRASLDGGETFLPSVKVSDTDYDPSRNNLVPLFPDGDWTELPQSTSTLGIGWFTFSGGHTAGLAADADGKFHPLWVANPSGVPQLWTTDITVAGNAEINGGPELAALKDASKAVRLEFVNRFYNRKTHTVDADLQLENVSESNVGGPLKVRVLDVGSNVARVTIQSGEREAFPEGAIWDFTPWLVNGRLEPGEITKPIHIRFNVRGLDPFSALVTEAGIGRTVLATVTTKVLASSIDSPKKPPAQQTRNPQTPTFCMSASRH